MITIPVTAKHIEMGQENRGNISKWRSKSCAVALAAIDALGKNVEFATYNGIMTETSYYKYVNREEVMSKMIQLDSNKDAKVDPFFLIVEKKV